MNHTRRVTARTPNAVQVIQDALSSGARVMAHCGHWFEVKAFKTETEGEYCYWYAQPRYLRPNQKEGLVWYNVNTLSVEVLQGLQASGERQNSADPTS